MSLRKVILVLSVVGGLAGVARPVVLYAESADDDGGRSNAVDAGVVPDASFNIPGTGGSPGLGLPGAGGMAEPVATLSTLAR